MAQWHVTTVGNPDHQETSSAYLLALPGVSGAPLAKVNARTIAGVIDIKDSDTDQTCQQILAAAHARHLDIALQPLPLTPIKLFLADMDSTMIQEECIDELAAFAGIKDKIAAITAAAMRGELDFPSALKERVSLLKGLPETAIDDCLRDRITLMPGARTLLDGLRARGIRCVLVSGGFTAFTSKIADRLGFHRTVANILEVKEGVLTGGLTPPLRDGNSKREILLEEAAALGITPEAVAAIGDGANDREMTNSAGLGVAHHGKPTLRAATKAHIDFGHLDVMLDFIDARS